MIRAGEHAGRFVMASHAASVAGKLGICESDQALVAAGFGFERAVGYVLNKQLTVFRWVLIPACDAGLRHPQSLSRLDLSSEELDYVLRFHPVIIALPI